MQQSQALYLPCSAAWADDARTIRFDEAALPDDGIAACTLALETGSEAEVPSQMLTQRGVHHQTLGRLDGAEQDYLEAADIAPDQMEPCYDLFLI